MRLLISLVAVCLFCVELDALGNEDIDVLRSSGNCVNCQLDGVEIEKEEFIAADLRGASLSSVNFESVNLQKANLTGAKLNYATLAGVNCRRCQLKQAKLEGANLF